jgi:hypothetical protein
MKKRPVVADKGLAFGTATDVMKIASYSTRDREGCITLDKYRALLGR